MSEDKEKDYRVTCHRFEGTNSIETGWSGYCYKIWFNKSIQHTDKYLGIEKGLDAYSKWEKTSNPIKRWFIGLIYGFK